MSSNSCAQYTRLRRASVVLFTTRFCSSRWIARCAVVNAMLNRRAAPVAVINGLADNSSMIREAFGSPANFLRHWATTSFIRLARLRASSDIRATPSRKYSIHSCQVALSLTARRTIVIISTGGLEERRQIQQRSRQDLSLDQ